MKRVSIQRAALPAFAALLTGCTISSHTISTKFGNSARSLAPSLSSPDSVIAQACVTAGSQPGSTRLRRLTNSEYNNSVRDLLFTLSRPGDTFQSTSIGPSGFSNDSTALTVSPQTVADYASAAEQLATEVIASKGQPGGAYAKIASCAMSVTAPSAACAQAVLSALATRAYRRPVPADPSDPELQSLMKILAGEPGFDQGLHDVILALLIDPRFLFTYIGALPAGASTALLDDFELASRLSYFLWSSMPDDELLNQAKMGKLKEGATLQAEVKRMLADPKAAPAIAKVLREDWARLIPLNTDGSYGSIDAQTVTDMRTETQLFLQDLVTNDRNPLDLVTSGYTYVNQNLASYYGWNVPAANSSSFIRTAIPDANRRGVLTQASVMLVQGGGATYTHPVQRGRWVMDSYLCTPPPPRPPNVPDLPAPTSTGGTMRQLLTVHASATTCYFCHASMDVIGLGLENFDMSGKWRYFYPDAAQSPVNATGTMPGSFSFSTPRELIDGLAQQSQVKTCMAQKLMAYSLSRAVASSSDQCVAGAIGQTVSATSTFSDMVSHVVLSPEFRIQGAQ